MYNKMRTKFFLILLFLMWVLIKINVDISWSVITKYIEFPLMSTCFACKNIFTKHLIELLLIPSGDGEQKPGPVKEKSYFNGM